jgi:hypothetical protein
LKINLGGLFKKLIKFFFMIIYITTIIGMVAGGITAGIWTLIPAEAFGWTVSKISYLGYASTCSFTPFSSLMLFGMALLGFFALIKLIKYVRRISKASRIVQKSKLLMSKIKLN